MEGIARIVATSRLSRPWNTSLPHPLNHQSLCCFPNRYHTAVQLLLVAWPHSQWAVPDRDTSRFIVQDKEHSTHASNVQYKKLQHEMFVGVSMLRFKAGCPMFWLLNANIWSTTRHVSDMRVEM